MAGEIFFAHANGFPSKTYQKLLAALQPDYGVRYLERHGHDPRFPVGRNWQCLTDELIHHLEQGDQPVLGVGHSLGGILHYHAALQRPDLYQGVVMLDSPVLTKRDQWFIRAAKGLGFIDRVTPAARSLGRREQFASRQQARDYFSAKSLFRDFDPECLEAYVEHGLHPVEQGFALRFDPAIEMQIYRNIPHHNPGSLNQLQVPLLVVKGEQSPLIREHQCRFLSKQVHAQLRTLPGSHMFPLERPEETAHLLRSVFHHWAHQRKGHL